ncbi:flavodoxin family protein [Caldisericum exile]|uniref:Flavodoxin domain-containing protein n=1 Tax=Caldisericum exile (strain DSM 21853 / NBRC 104410 / AZM16c01) TaxID=511051 RepID=A0A7U6GFM6_CALEA|nr:hypothetical protein [Caldisericum exile]BAL81527.1 hypothetical protein CSE_14010 [Caldisericum exile AZM16c01]
MNEIAVYFSGTGKNKLLGEAIKEIRDCKILEIKDNLKRNFFRDAFYTIIGKVVDIEPSTFDFDEFEKVFILTPIWASNIPFPMRSFIVKNRNALINKEIIFVSSSGFGERNKSVLTKLNEILGSVVEKALFVKEADVNSGKYRELLEKFLNEL